MNCGNGVEWFVVEYVCFEWYVCDYGWCEEVVFCVDLFVVGFDVCVDFVCVVDD